MDISQKLFLKLFGSLLKIYVLFLAFAGMISMFYSFKEEDVLNYKHTIFFLVSSYILYAIANHFEKIEADISEIENRRYVVIALAGVAWILFPLIGCIPYLIEGFSFLDAFFNSMSATAAVGTSTIENFENLSFSLRFWISFQQWTGAIGILTFLVLVLSKGAGWLQTISVNWEQIRKEGIKNYLKKVMMFYVLITLIAIILFILSGMDIERAVLFSMNAISTGGIYTPTLTPMQKILTSFIVVLGSIGVLYLLMAFRNKQIFKIIVYYIMFLLLLSIISTLLFKMSFSDSLFYITSASSTTGVATHNIFQFNKSFLYLLLVLMLIGGFSGSLSGGIKFDRLIVILKYIKYRIEKMLNPSLLKVESFCGIQINEDTFISSVLVSFSFQIASWIFVFIGSLFLHDIFKTNFIVVSFISTGFSIPVEYLSFPIKLLGILLIWLGRMDIIGGFAFVPSIIKLIRRRK